MSTKLKKLLNELGMIGLAKPHRRLQEEDVKLSLEEKRKIMDMISNYNEYGQKLHRESDLVEVAETLSELAKSAQKYALSELDDWFDQKMVEKNMKELSKLSEAFNEIAKETSIQEKRLNALYDDMGHILSRYFKISQ